MYVVIFRSYEKDVRRLLLMHVMVHYLRLVIPTLMTGQCNHTPFNRMSYDKYEFVSAGTSGNLNIIKKTIYHYYIFFSLY
jgi:hypothetical protein